MLEDEFVAFDPVFESLSILGGRAVSLTVLQFPLLKLTRERVVDQPAEADAAKIPKSFIMSELNGKNGMGFKF